MSSRVFPVGRWLAGTAVCGTLGLASQAFGQAPADPPVAVAVDGAAAPGAVVPPAAPAADCCDEVFRKVPPVYPYPRPGFFPVPPTGPGYYSLLDAVTGNCRQCPPRYGYPRHALMSQPFFDADFRYLDDPNNTDTDRFDPLKRVRVGDNWLFSTGGQTSSRLMNEYNSRLTAGDNNYLLSRARVYGDLRYRDQLRFYAEFIGAYSSWQDLPPLPIDQNKADFLNLFVDVKLTEIDCHPAYVRVGRQELLYGSQRLISPPDWANTRRTFQGVRTLYHGTDWDFDTFWVRPVLPKANELDDWDHNQDFAGMWATHRPAPGQAIDLYYLMLDNRNVVTQLGIPRSPYTIHTIGSRYVGDHCNEFLWDLEGAVQLGSRGSPTGRDSVVAWMGTAGVGHHWKDAPLTPTAWVYYDYASGDDNPAAGRVHTFNQLFPFGHYYMGWTDQVGRQNIHDLNAHLYLYPAKWVQLQLQYHNFWLASRQDALYNAAGNAIRRDPTGAAGSHVGQEVDVIANFHLTQHADLLTGYSHLYGGEFLKNTAGAGGSKDTGLFWLMVNYRW